MHDFDAMWDYDDPAATEQRFRAVLPAAAAGGDRAYHAELLTQLARTQSLQRQFDAAHALLDEADAMVTDAMPRARVRSRLERGRTLNSDGAPARAHPLFVAAWDEARAAGLDGLAVDAAHMVAIVEPDTAEALRWNELALELARTSSDADATRWQGSLANNVGWTHHEAGEYEAALASFEIALAHQRDAGDAAKIRIARWCRARCLRSLGRPDEALAEQRELAIEGDAADRPDGYVHEELGECLLALGRDAEARPSFRRAHELLGADAWLRESEPQRLARLAELGSGA